jgi:hypothetical protein
MRPTLVAILALVGACAPKAAPVTEVPHAPTFAASKIYSFTDTFAVTSVVDGGAVLWAGTPRGLMRWDLASGKFSVIGQKEGLPADRVGFVAVDGKGGIWAATAKGVMVSRRGVRQTFPPAPVGDFITGLVPSSDGKFAWAAGPEGLARLKDGNWERFLSDIAITALVAGSGNTLWAGTSGKGVLRVLRSGDKIAQYGAAQGQEVDVVRGMSTGEKGLLVVGDGEGGPRASIYDGERFYSYKVECPSVLEWAASGGGQLYVGSGETLYEVSPTVYATDPPPAGPLKFLPTSTPQSRAPQIAALAADMKATALDLASGSPAPPPSKRAQGARGPRMDTTLSSVRLPDGVTAVGSSERGLLVGTRFLGAERIENGVVRSFRTGDLTATAERITVACAGNADCYLATGAERAWHFDGRAFDIAPVDPEPSSRVLAILRDPKGQVIAIHRGATDPHLRISSVVDGRWTPIAMQSVQVPHGVPELNFATYAPDGKLWVGLRYVDKEKDSVDWGAAELLVDSGEAIYHRQAEAGNGLALPNDVVAVYWRARNEAWFATRQGAARLLDGKLRVFTENDGLESEIITDIGPGDHGDVWVATRRGTGRFDGKLWTFPKMGPFYLAARALASDAKGHVFVGTDKGLFCVGDCAPDAIDSRRGLLDDDVLDLTVDDRGRVWALTKKGITIVEP